MTTALERGERSGSRLGRCLPRGKTRYPLYRRLGGPQGRSGQVRIISPPPGFDPRTVQKIIFNSSKVTTHVNPIMVRNVHTVFRKHCFRSPVRKIQNLTEHNLTLRLLMSYIYIYIYIYMVHLFLMFLDHTQRRSTVGRTPLDE